MSVISRNIWPVCGSLCCFCPALRERSRHPIKRYKKLLADIFPRSPVRHVFSISNSIRLRFSFILIFVDSLIDCNIDSLMNMNHGIDDVFFVLSVNAG